VTSDEVLAGTAAILAKLFGADPQTVTRETTALQIWTWDSISHIHLLLEVEKTFGIEFPEERAFDMVNVGELVDIVVERLGAAGAAGRS
jgi:acyl carrier protein